MTEINNASDGLTAIQTKIAIFREQGYVLTADDENVLIALENQAKHSTQKDLNVRWVNGKERRRKGKQEAAGLMPIVTDPDTGEAFILTLKFFVKHEIDPEYYCFTGERGARWKVRDVCTHPHGYSLAFHTKQQTAAIKTLEETRGKIGWFVTSGEDSENREFVHASIDKIWHALSMPLFHRMLPSDSWRAFIYLGTMCEAERLSICQAFRKTPPSEIVSLEYGMARAIQFIPISDLIEALSSLESNEDGRIAVAPCTSADLNDATVRLLNRPIVGTANHPIRYKCHELIHSAFQSSLKGLHNFLAEVVSDIAGGTLQSIQELPSLSEVLSIELKRWIIDSPFNNYRIADGSKDWITNCRSCGSICGLWADEIREGKSPGNEDFQCGACVNLFENIMERKCVVCSRFFVLKKKSNYRKCRECNYSNRSQSYEIAEAKRNKSKPSHIPCRNWNESGTCKYGNNCRFSHE